MSEIPISNAVSRLSDSDYSEILGMLCPYCRISLPSTLDASKPNWIHTIHDTDHRFECHAYAIRSQRNAGFSIDDGVDLYSLNLSDSSAHRFSEAGLLTAGDVRAKTDEELLANKGIGRKHLKEVRATLNKRMMAMDDFARPA